MPPGYSPSLRHSDETGWLPRISERAVWTVAWVAKEAGVVQRVRAAREGPGRRRRYQNVPDRPAFESRPASGHVPVVKRLSLNRFCLRVAIAVEGVRR